MQKKVRHFVKRYCNSIDIKVSVKVNLGISDLESVGCEVYFPEKEKLKI